MNTLWAKLVNVITFIKIGNKVGFMTYQEVQERLIQEKHKRLEQMKKRWEENKTPFVKAYEVPDLPIVDAVEWKTFYVPILIERGAIQKEKLIVGKRYYGKCRNANVVVWLGEVFEYQRYKFGYTFPEKINHFEDDNGYDLFVPIRELEEGEEVDDE